MPRLLLVDLNAGDPAERSKAHALCRRGWEVTVLAPRRIRESGRDVEAAPSQPADPFRLVLGEVVGKPPNRCVFTRGLSEAFEHEPDVVHVLADEGFAVALQILLEARRRCPRALRIGHTWQNIATTWRRHGQPLFALYAADCAVEAAVFALADGMVARNAEAVGVLRGRGYRGPIAHVPWGIDVETVRQAALSQPPAETDLASPLLGFVGRLVPEKGVDTLLRALARTRGSLQLIGDGPERQRLEALARELGIGDRVRFLGSVPRAQVPGLLRGLDVLVLPSRETAGWKEQFGRVLVEAMALGIPCVGSDSGAIPSVIGEGGASFGVDDSVALAGAIERVVADRSRLSPLASARAELFTWDRFAETSVGFFESLRGTR
jgi:glycosyltransferase involved in cell wall biosynthesis